MQSRSLFSFPFLLLAAASIAAESKPAVPVKSAPTPAALPFVPNTTGLDFIDTSFENASPVWYEQTADGVILVHLLYDHERASPNRAAGHVHILLHGKPGAKLTLDFTNIDNVWNGVRSSVGPSMRTMSISENGRDWKVLPLEHPAVDRVRLTVEMPGPRLYLARLEPYRLSDLAAFLASIQANPLVQITPIGKTVQDRALEIVRVGDPKAPYRVFLRARAHPWEPAGNWVVQGLIRRLLRNDGDARKFLGRYCVYVMPMANKDGVAQGRTRFNAQGKDLNRNWDLPADSGFVPENAALEKWLEGMIAAGQKPDFAMELHNDGGGRLHISRTPGPTLERYLERMVFFEKLLRQHTWFTEGPTAPSFKNSGTLGDGWLARYQIDAVVHEFNANVIGPSKVPPLGRHWEEYGANLATVFHEYFGEMKR